MTAEIGSIVAGVLLGIVVGSTMLSTSASAQDIQAYCAKVGDDDRVQPIPDALLQNARRMFDVQVDEADSYVQATTSARCMNGAVWLCNYGANSIGVPMSATGHATVYDWRCVGREARIAGQIVDVDARGFIAGNWKQLQ
jgi:hypothetical protein